MTVCEDYRARADEVEKAGQRLVDDMNARGETLPRMVVGKKEGRKAPPLEIVRRVTEQTVLERLSSAVEGLRLLADFEEGVEDATEGEKYMTGVIALEAIKLLFTPEE